MSSSSQQTTVPATALNENQWAQINQITAAFSREQLTWTSGYLAGLAHGQGPTIVAPQAELVVAKSMTILYGSQTGNAKALASEYKAKLDALNISASLANMADYKLKQLKTETHLVVIVSTHGEGEAPDDAVEFHQFLASRKAPKLNDLKFSVLGLGDSSYEFFCQTAKDIDTKLAALGANRMLERVDCDVDYDASAESWTNNVSLLVKEELTTKPSSQVVPMPGVARTNLIVADSQQYTKKNPFAATLLESQKITGRDSIKDIRHIEISLEGSGIQYRPGDALGIWFNNDLTMVEQLLGLLSIDKTDVVELSGKNMSIQEALVEKLELTQSYPTFVKAYVAATHNAELSTLVENKTALREYLAERQIIDVVREHPASLSAQQLAYALRGITPRLYSIASSQDEVEDEVHLTVALVEYDAHGHPHQGGASGYLAKRLDAGGEVNVFVEKNNNFRLPENSEKQVIMIGPGTGIAPFRAFMQQRQMDEAEGENWLFFGNPHYTQDFLYQTEWQRFVKDGVLNKVSLAFSRDQQEKVYVQHRLLEQGAELYQWLEAGAHLYVCGDADHMAKDVHDALISIVQQHGQKTTEEAEQYISALRRAKRYQKDVY
jgi:sulfite reductase (NADPH) flavoprotein alpha-component